MNFATGFLVLLAAAQTIVAFPFGASHSHKSLAPVTVIKLTCDGDTTSCTGNLDYADGSFSAVWSVAIFHTGLKFGVPDHKKALQRMAMAPVAVSQVNCDGDTNQCTGNLVYDDNAWVAQWSVDIFHSFTGAERSISPVPVTQITCDGDTNQCTGHLDYGDGAFVAQWGFTLLHEIPSPEVKASFLRQ